MSITQIHYVATDALRPHKQNARTHSNKQLKQIAKSIQTFGFTNPVLIDDSNVILAGHGRVEAARMIGMDSVPCLQLSSMTADQKRAYLITDNKLALNAGWDDDMLSAELQALLDIEPDIDIDVIGFSIAEIDSLIEAQVPEEAGDPRDDALPDDFATSSVCRPGDIWQLGAHRLSCGDALDAENIACLMDGNKATMVFTDPPYNVPIDGHVGGSGKTKHREFAFATGEMNSKEFTSFLQTSFQNLTAHSCDGSIHFICMDWRHMSEMLSAGSAAYDELKNLIVWVKDNGGMGTFYRSRHELIFAYKAGTAPHINSFELGQNGRYRTNVWEYKGVNSFGSGRMENLVMHPTVKPVQLISDAIRDCSSRSDIILDIFGGSGSTLIAAHRTGRRAFLNEIDPPYCDRIIARWEAIAKDEAQLIACGIGVPIPDGQPRRAAP